LNGESSAAVNALWRIAEWFPALESTIIDKMRQYHAEMLRFNARLNLISRNTEREADELHFADCILAIQAMAKVQLPAEVFDLGSGNGLPGIVMALFYPNIRFRLVEGDGRKCEFLKHVSHHLGLNNIEIMNLRLETLAGANMEAAVTRGFASISKACLMGNRTFKVGGRLFHFKGNSWSSEIAEIPSQLMSVWKPELIGEYSLPVSQARRAIVCTLKKV
jgi:16S rRNA (guanine527-N7)-methyltransferase